MSSSTSSGETGKAIADLNTNYANIFGNVVLAFIIKKTSSMVNLSQPHYISLRDTAFYLCMENHGDNTTMNDESVCET